MPKTHSSVVFLSLLTASAMSLASPNVDGQIPFSDEAVVTELKLAYPLDQADMEFSGLTWCGDTLVLLPQYPERNSPFEEPSLHLIEKKSILDYLNEPDPTPLESRAIKLFENDIRDRMTFFDGFEAIACKDNTLWFSIEAVSLFGRYQAYIVPAELDLDADSSNISIRTDQIRYVESQSGIRNKGDEAIFVHGQHLVSLHEVNDPRKVDQPKANRVHRVTGGQDQIEFMHLPYRITDATASDPNGRFWVINYKYSGDDFSRNAVDNLAEDFPPGASHQKYYNVERLIEYQIQENKIVRTQTAPIQLLLEGKEGRNWEGIVRLNEIGFLLITDKHPNTLLGFVSNLAQPDVDRSR